MFYRCSFFSIVVLVAIPCALAQDIQLDFAVGMGGTSGDGVNEIAVDNSGNVIVAGYYAGTADFDPGAGIAELSIKVGLDGFTAKYDADGNLLWARPACGSGGNETWAVAVDSSGNVYETGGFNFTQDFDPGADVFEVDSFGGEDAFIRKLDTDGAFVWMVQLGGDGQNRGYDVSVDGNGNVLNCGILYNSGDFDPGPGGAILESEEKIGAYVCKLNANAEYQWAHRIGFDTTAVPYVVTADSVGNVYVAGEFLETADFDPSGGMTILDNMGLADAFVVKYDPDGALLWARSIGGEFRDVVYDLVVDGAGDVYLTGEFSDTVDFDPGVGVFELTINGGPADAFVCKLDTDGNFVWARNLGGGNNDTGRGIALDSLGNVYTSGGFVGSSADFDPGPGQALIHAAGLTDIYVSKLDANGDFVWVRGMGGTGGDLAYSVAAGSNGLIYAAGFFAEITNFERGIGTYELTSAGGQDAFIARLGPGGANCGGRADINDDCVVDAVDVQLVINAALGFEVEEGHEPDVSGDTQVDAVDVQLVINAALGLDIE